MRHNGPSLTKIILLTVGLWLSVPAWAQKSLSPGETAQLVQRSVQDVIDHIVDESRGVRPERGAECVSKLLPIEPRLANLVMDSDGVQAVRIYHVWMAQCKGIAQRHQGQPVTVQDLQEWMTPWRQAEAAFSAKSPSTSERFGYSVFDDWQLMRVAQFVGISEEGEAHFHKSVEALIQKATSQPPDQQANDELRFLARLQYGHWQFQSQILRTQAILEKGLGAGHPASLLMLRTAAYHERFMGRADQALIYIERATKLTQLHHPQDQELQAHMAAEHAACLSSAGRLAEALPMLLKARDYFEAKQPTPWMNVTRLNYNLAGLALDMGDYDHAIEYAERAMDQAQQSGIAVLQDAEIVVPATTKALAQLRKGEAGAAMRLKDALLIIPPPPGNREMHVGAAAFALVQDSVRRGDAAMLSWAAAYTDDHIASFRAPLQAESALRPLMLAWREAGPTLASANVRAPLDRSLAIGLGGRSPGTAVLTQFSMARHLASPRPGAAIWLYKRAANQLQQMRAGLPTDDQDLYRSWLSNYEDDLRAFVNLLIDEGRLPEAEQVLQLVRNEELFEFTRRSKGRRAGETESLSLTPQEQAADMQMNTLVQQAETAARAADARLDALRLAALRNNYHDPRADGDLQMVQDALHTLLESALPPQRHASDVTTRGAAPLPPGTARLTYLVSRDGVDIISRIGNRSVRHHVAVGAAALNALVHQARTDLNHPQTDPRPAMQRLWRTLLAPVLPRLQQAQVRHLELVPEGTLRYLPFAALHDGKRFLVQAYDLRTQWGGQTDDDLRAHHPNHRTLRTVLGVGRTIGSAQHPPLPGVTNELAAIGGVSDSILVDDAFTSDALRAGLERNPAVVHIASHFVLDPAGEDKSYLLLGDGQKMSLTELKQLPWTDVQLALLSACDSAVSVDQGDGREWMGFANTLAQAGVRNVLATLWRIEDGSTAQWMKLFYVQLRGTQGQAPSPRTLANAQRAWLKTRRGSALAHPYYWAPFVWLGGA